MAESTRHGLSQRGWNNVEGIMPKIRAAVQERKVTNSANIDLSTAENWLIRPELIDICKESIAQNLEPRVSNKRKKTKTCKMNKK